MKSTAAEPVRIAQNCSRPSFTHKHCGDWFFDLELRKNSETRLAGRKRDLWLAPMCLLDMDDAKQTDLKHRFSAGGLPPFFLPENTRNATFRNGWTLTGLRNPGTLRLERRDSFQRFTELVMAQSGGIFDATRFARPCEVSRPTITNYLRVLEATFVAHVIRPFSTRRPH